MTAGCAMCGHDGSVPTFGEWTFFIPHLPRSQNRLKGISRHVYARERDSWVLLLRSERHAMRIPEAGESNRRRVLIERLYAGHGRAQDRGNLVGGCKPVVDAMRIAGLIFDDSEKWLDDFYRQRRHAGLAGLAITIWELTPP